MKNVILEIYLRAPRRAITKILQARVCQRVKWSLVVPIAWSMVSETQYWSVWNNNYIFGIYFRHYRYACSDTILCKNQVKPRSKQSRITYHFVSDLFAVKFNDMRYFRKRRASSKWKNSESTKCPNQSKISKIACSSRISFIVQLLIVRNSL